MLSAQDYTLSGTVENASNETVSYANIQLLKGVDSTLIDGTSADENGRFEIQRVPQGSYFIKASYIENESELRPIEVNAELVLEPLRLNEGAQALKEVVVISQKPRLERKVDRLVFNIENSALSDSDIWDALKRTPNVVIVNDQLTVKGSAAVGILINGRKVNLPKSDIINLLSGTSASDVEAIEVITAPPAKYGAEDAVLINIRKKSNLVAGYNGAVYNGYKQGLLPKHRVGTDHYFKGKKTEFSINYSFNHDREIVKYTDVTDFFENNSVSSTWTAEQYNRIQKKRHNLSAFFDYDIDPKNRLSFSTINVYQPDVARLYNTKTSIAGDTLSGFNTLNDSEQRDLNSSYYLDYVRKLDKEGAELSFNAHYTYYDYERKQNLNTVFLGLDDSSTGRNDFTTDAEQRIDLYSVQGDYSVPLGETSKFETGLRYAGITSESEVAQQGFDRDRPGIDPTEAGNFKYDESIFAAYASYSGNWNKWDVKAGLRAEYTLTEGKLDVEAQGNTNDYLKLFPTFSVQFQPTEDHELKAYYYRRLERPRYADINPFRVFQSNFLTIEGNPDLLPGDYQYMAAGYTYKNSYTVEVFYSPNKNRLGQLIFQDNDTKLLRFVQANIMRDRSWGIDFIFTKSVTAFWYCYFLASVFDDKYVFKNKGTDERVEYERVSVYLRSNNSFSFLRDKSLTADLSFTYIGPGLANNVKMDGFGSLDLMLRKTLWQKRLGISMGVEDILNQGNEFSTRDYLDQKGTSLRRGENRLFVLALRYKFGNTGIKDNYKSKAIDERDRL